MCTSGSVPISTDDDDDDDHNHDHNHDDGDRDGGDQTPERARQDPHRRRPGVGAIGGAGVLIPPEPPALPDA